MSDEQEESGDIAINPVMDMLNKLQKTAKEQSKINKQKHLALVEDPDALRIFYEDVTRLDTWLLYSEAIPYCRAVEPSQWSSIEHGYRHWTDQLKPLMKASVGDTLKVINPDAKEKDWRVKPKEFVKWLHSKGMRPRKELEDVLKLKFTTNEAKNESNYSEHPNAEHHAQKRQQILEAALAILANYPDQCMDKGKVSGAAIARIMEEKSTLWFKYDDIPLSVRKVRELINQALKLPDA